MPCARKKQLQNTALNAASKIQRICTESIILVLLLYGLYLCLGGIPPLLLKPVGIWSHPDTGRWKSGPGFIYYLPLPVERYEGNYRS